MRPHPTPWTTHPEAAALLASCAKDPPERRTFPYAFGETDTRYIGARVARLRRLWETERERLLAEADATGDYSAFGACCALTPTMAIAAAIEARLTPAIRKAA